MNKQELIDQLKYMLDNNMVPLIEVIETYNIHPKAIEKFRVTEKGIEFTATFRGTKIRIKADYQYILGLRARTPQEPKVGSSFIPEDDED